MKKSLVSLILFSALMLYSCAENESDYQYYGYVVTGEQGAAEPLSGIKVHIRNSYEDEIYAETTTSDAGIFILKVKKNDISDIDEIDWSEDVRLIVYEESNKYYSTSREIPYPYSLEPKVDCGVIFLKLRDK